MAPKGAKAVKAKQKPQDEQREASLQAVVSRTSSACILQPVLIEGRFSLTPSKRALYHSHWNGRECVSSVELNNWLGTCLSLDIVPIAAGKHAID